MKFSELHEIREVKVKHREGEISFRIREGLSWGDWMDIQGIEDEVDRGIEMFMRAVCGWDLKDDSGAEAPVTREAIRSMPASVVIKVMAEIERSIRERQEASEEKKNPSPGA